MDTIGTRLRAERERLGFGQEEFGAKADSSKQTQLRYELDRRSPDATYLEKIASVGADILFVITGVRQTRPLDREALIDAIAGVEDYLTRNGGTLSANKKAELVELVYEDVIQDGKLDSAKILRLVKLAS